MLQTVLSQIGAHDFDKQQIINALFSKDAIEIGRKLPCDKDEKELKEVRSKQAVLSHVHEYEDDDHYDDLYDGAYSKEMEDFHVDSPFNHENDHLRLVYHGNPTYVKNMRSEIEEVWKLMGEYCKDENNKQNVFTFKLQPGQILIMDNTSFLHGRTPYDKHNLRVLHRLNFYHNGLLRKSVKLGINKDVIHLN